MHDLNMAENDWQTVGLPVKLLDLVDKIIKDSNFGYSSKAEFIKEAIRERILEMEKAGLIKLRVQED